MSKFIFINLFTLGILLAACGADAAPTPAQSPSATLVEPQSTQYPTPIQVTPPSATGISSPVPVVGFANDVLPIFNTSCNKCHGIEQIKEGLDMTSYENLMAGSFNGSVITPGDSGNSFLIELVVQGKMPKRGSKLTAEQIKTLSDWVDQGALDN